MAPPTGGLKDPGDGGTAESGMSPQRIACLIAITAFEPMSIWVIPFHWMGGGPLAMPAPESRRRA
jgi:hypothetical protein